MLSEQTAQQDGSFVVRIWWEHGGGDGQGALHWRGWIQHVRNGHQVYFSSMADLTSFIEQESGIRSTTGETTRGIV
jgi:hypothetical protein